MAAWWKEEGEEGTGRAGLPARSLPALGETDPECASEARYDDLDSVAGDVAPYCQEGVMGTETHPPHRGEEDQGPWSPLP
jgi:hypothetical protein